MILGSLGEHDDFLLQSDYNGVAFPMYSNPIKLSATLVNFGKESENAFLKAQERQSKELAINFNDSIQNKSQYVKLQISDRLELITSLNNSDNEDVFEFIKNNKDVHAITSLAIALNQEDLDKIAKTDELFLEASGIKTYSLNLYNDGKFQQKINFNDGVVFAYQTSKCCWKENDRHQVEIVDLVEGNDNCPNGSYTSAKRAKKKINYYKF
ncbi:hypothetical protein ESY86_09550 [Subsaximicrobium wynnwilliamsii]|uniref:Uncharacterized protein n=1 Tax=Subsaximicrobium wynnwilliamsii TaxID=291179 RepID=A0A5C6ZJ05_9FLAO|nr:hypothetical protein [Subsaximicrobium wynnwilliamsii]TXD83449.1 hypothetical protein ESY87_09260 [Subsaximicrobium wynnwilliamsii]TXD89276.1 hypothetical protein ESY86_09550 [Subsaximicrobium wynnwilliamsii]TXE03129.1 hypothetical protein ESY88_08970 [Subsaximicrobium wynnwilliamsii]